MKSLIFVASLLIATASFAQVNRSMTSDGNWDNASKWSGSNIADDINENASLGNNVDATIRNNYNYTIRNLTFGNNATLEIEPNGSLDLGADGTPGNLTVSNGGDITVDGTLIIWGNVQVGNNLEWEITGTVIIKGSVIMGNNAEMTVSGDLTVDGNFIAGNNADVYVSGGIHVGGDVVIGSNGDLTGCGGCFTIGGSCSGPNSFCQSSVLPVIFTHLSVEHIDENSNTLHWATSMEVDFEKFVVEHSKDGVEYHSIGEVYGQGFNVFDTENRYTFTDQNPHVGWNYYRLKAVDLDQKFEYSRVVSAWNEPSRMLWVTPNPARGQLHVYTNFGANEEDHVVLLNQLGKPVLEVSPDEAGEGIALGSDITPGLYFLRYKSRDREYVTRVIIQN